MAEGVGGVMFDAAPTEFDIFCREESGYTEMIHNQSEQLVIVIWWIPTILGLFFTEFTLLYMVLCHFPQNLIFYIISTLINEPRPPTCNEMNDMFSDFDVSYAFPSDTQWKRNAYTRGNYAYTSQGDHGALSVQSTVSGYLSSTLNEAMDSLTSSFYSSASVMGIERGSFSADLHKSVYTRHGITYSPASPCHEVMIVWSLCSFIIMHNLFKKWKLSSSKWGDYRDAGGSGRRVNLKNTKFSRVLVLWSSFVTVGVIYSKLNFFFQTVLGFICGFAYGTCCAYFLEFFLSESIPNLLKLPLVSWIGYYDNIYGWKLSVPKVFEGINNFTSKLKYANTGEGCKGEITNKKDKSSKKNLYDNLSSDTYYSEQAIFSL